jgi:pyrroloquinoline quinone biosynthesis protein B
MRIHVLGSAAGGGFPQWNCACENCELVRRADARVEARTQDSLCVEAAAGNLLINASPDVLRQIERAQTLWPQSGRSTGISAIVLTNGDLDHVLGLFSLRESQPLVVYATERVWRGLHENAMMKTLARFDGHVRFARIVVGEARDVPEVGVTLTAFAAPGKAPVHLPGEPHAEDNVMLRIESKNNSSARVSIATAVRDVRDVRDALIGSNATFLDGTFFSSDELIAKNLGRARAEDMAHHPLGGESGSLAALRGANIGRKILTHVNNTNPILRSDSRESAYVKEMGWEIARDGMEIVVS